MENLVINAKFAEQCLNGTLSDVVEMDAASNNSVEDIRAIRDEVNFLPTRAKYRVYIIDEVHMLSTGAFNALLKTLEEPPAHVKFILATTEPQKLPATILSRCQRFDFKRISNDDVIKRLKIICKESNIEITDDALKIIAVLSEGAMRDAISILERCTGEQKGLIDENAVRDLVGIPKTTQIHSIVSSIVDSNVDEVINNVNEIVNEGKDIDNFLWEIIKYIKDILVYKSSKNLEIYSEEEKNRISKLADKISKGQLLHLIYELSELSNLIKWSSQKTIMFEAEMIKACTPINTNEMPVNQDIQTQNINQNKVVTNNIPQQKNIENNKQETKKEIKPSSTNNVSAKTANGANLPYWNKVIDKIKQSGKMGIYVNLIGSKAREINDMTIEVVLANKNSFARNVLETHENKTEIEKITSIEAGKTMNVRFADEESKMENISSSGIENLLGSFDIPINIIDE